MKSKLLLIAALVALSLGAYAQSAPSDSVANSPIKFRAETGYGQTYLHGNNVVTSPYHVIRVGGTVEFPLSNGLGIETGLKYGYAFGKRQQLYLPRDTAFFRYAGHQLDVPIRLTYSVPIFWGMKLFGYAGPNINIGLAQQSETRQVIRKREEGQPAPDFMPPVGTFDLYATVLNRISFQLGAGGGVQWRNYRLRSGYDWGLNNLAKDKDRAQRMRGWYVAFEYEF